jgi:hypothetical protein
LWEEFGDFFLNFGGFAKKRVKKRLIKKVKKKKKKVFVRDLELDINIGIKLFNWVINGIVSMRNIYYKRLSLSKKIKNGKVW